MKLDQIAHYAINQDAAEAVKRTYGLENANWVSDIVEGDVWTRDFGEGRSKAILQFNYDLGIELEILTYLHGPFWHQDQVRLFAEPQFLSHVGFHVDDLPENDGHWGPLVQRMTTTSHTNPALPPERRYKYRIFDSRKKLGFYSKFIRRWHD